MMATTAVGGALMAAPTRGTTGWIVAGLLLLALLGQCGKDGPPSLPPTDATSLPALAEPRSISEPNRSQFVQSQTLNCRAAPGTSNRVVTTFRQGERITILKDRDGWSEVEYATRCWVLAAHLGWTEPPPRREATAPTYGFAAPSAPRRASSGAYYANCSAARAAGAAPVYAGEPGYSRKLDRDGDGVGCE